MQRFSRIIPGLVPVAATLALVACAPAAQTLLALTDATATATPGATATPTGQATPTPGVTTSPVPAGDPMVGALAFLPGRDGFGFENYGGDSGAINLTAAEMVRLFGAGVCASGTGEACVLTPAAQSWMDETNQSMSGGHCEGMAVLSLLFHKGLANPTEFGSGQTTYDLPFADNAALQREIAYWFAQQGVSPTQPAERKDLTPVEVMRALLDSFKPGASEAYTLGIYKRGYQAGHAITPWGVSAGPGAVRYLQVYDNNHPGQERRVAVDTAANTWSYVAATNPNEPDSTYEGDATTGTLTLTPLSVRQQQQDCPVCEDLGASETPPASRGRQVFTQGRGKALVADGAGHRVGYVDGQFVNTFPGSRVMTPKGGDLWRQDVPPVFTVPGEGDLTVTLDGRTLTDDEDSSMTVVGPGYEMSVDDIRLDPGQQDRVKFHANGRRLCYTTETAETPFLTMGLQTEAADFAFEVIAGGDSDGHEVEMEIDQVKGQFRVEARGVTGETGFDLEIHRIDEQGDHVFRNTTNTLDKAATLWLDYAAWNGTGPMTIHVDTDEDGTPDQTLTLMDEGD
ncbi:MAG: hypothetical protein FJY99_13235 [Candidatus Sericytochromatia bacterium]|nr:hypothetical protein [Candidatus Tanganyikabacteria bacterium]